MEEWSDSGQVLQGDAEGSMLRAIRRVPGRMCVSPDGS